MASDRLVLFIIIMMAMTIIMIRMAMMLVLLMIRLPLFHDHGDHAYHDDHAQEAVPQEVCQMRKVQQASYSGHSQRTSDTTLLPGIHRCQH